MIYGLVSDVVPAADLDAAVTALCNKIDLVSAPSPPKARRNICAKRARA